VSDLVFIVGFVALLIVMGFVVRARRRQQTEFIAASADEEICQHLAAALDLLESRGLRVLRAGQKHPEMPFEIHMDGKFDPQTLYEELKLSEPARVSERGVLYCVEDWCEIHPAK
jgi:hypothetical protein